MASKQHPLTGICLAIFILLGSQISAISPALPANPGEIAQSFGLVQCTNIVDPSNGDTNVPVTTTISWDPALGDPTSYLLFVGTTPGGSDIVNQDVGNVTTFDPPGNLPAGTVIYVTVIGYNANGPATGCSSESFTTQGPTVPNCTALTSPANGATGVLPSTSLTWTAATGSPTGYRLNLGTTPGGTEVLSNFDVGNVTTFDPSGDLPPNSTIYVRVVPYNAAGNATGCSEQSFTTTSCTPGVVVTGGTVPPGTYRSLGDLIATTTTVASATNVTFISNTGISLGSDFTVELGAVFEAKIEGCQ